MLVALLSMSSFFAETCCDIDERMAENVPLAWETLVGSTRGEILEVFRAQERAAAAARNNTAGQNVTHADALDGRKDRVQESSLAAKHDRFNSNAYAVNAFVGNITVAGGKVLEHGNCTHKLQGTNLPCHHNLWPQGLDELKAHIARQSNMDQESRSQWCYERLTDKYFADPLPCFEEFVDPPQPPQLASLPSPAPNKMRWHYMVNGREVCKRTWCAVNCIGESTVEGYLPRIRDKRKFAYAKREEGTSNQTVDAIADFKRLSVIAWYQVHAEDVGDYMPERNEIVLPLRSRKEECDEYNCGRDADLVVHYAYFCEVIREAPEIQHIRHARPCYNFQKWCVATLWFQPDNSLFFAPIVGPSACECHTTKGD